MKRQRLHLSDSLSLPIDVVTEKLAFLGRTGSGKTYGAMKLAELMLDAGAQICAIDPVGVWHGLRVPATKGGRSFQVYVFGGLHHDIELHPTAQGGQLVADLICDNYVSAVLDVSQFIPSEQQVFVKAFGDRLFQRRKAKPAPLHLFVEECQEFVPQNPMGSEMDTLHTFQRIWKIARNFSIGGSLISQRPQEVNKKVLNMSGTLLAFQMTAPEERVALRKWVADAGVAVDIEAILQRLDVGQCHVERVQDHTSKTIKIAPRITADLSATIKVGRGRRGGAVRELSPIDVKAINVAMQATIEEAKANDPKGLRDQVKRLTAQREKLEAALAAEQARKQTPVPAPLKAADIKRLEKCAATVDGAQKALAAAVGPLQAAIATLAESKAAAVPVPAVPEYVATTPATSPAHARLIRSAARSGVVLDIIDAAGDDVARGVDTRVAMPPGELAILNVAVQLGPVDGSHLTVATGYRKSSRDEYVRRLVARGYLTKKDGKVTATAAGAAAVGGAVELPIGLALFHHWKAKLPKGEAEVLAVIHNTSAAGADVEYLEKHTRFERSSRGEYLRRLKARGLIVKDGARWLAVDSLFG